MNVTPRPYQRVATSVALKGLRGRQKRALVVLATGLGKTLTAAFIARQFRAKRILFLVHNNFILDHAIEEFHRVFGDTLHPAVFNGMSKSGVKQSRIVFATWQTMGRYLTAWKQDHFELIIVDEAHHTEAETFRPVIQYFTGAKLGITATPDREDKADIRGIFGPEIVNVTLEEAIARGWLPRIEYHVVTDESLDENALQQIAAEIREGKKRFTMAEVNRRIFIRKRDAEIARIIDGYNEKAVVFCASIKHAERMSKSLRLSTVFHSAAAKGQKETWRKNQAALQSLRNGTVRRVCAVNAFNEGVNVPSVGLVAFCRVTGVVTVFRQQLGRGLRPGKDKLVVLDFVGNLERVRLVQTIMNTISDLHETYTTTGERKSEGYTRKPFEVSGHGFEFTFSDRVVDLMKVLQHVEQDCYPTWQEASRAALALGLRTRPAYSKGYLRDPRLPGSPREWYPGYPGDTFFFGRRRAKHYPTWQEASRATIALGLTLRRTYKKGFNRDPRLPANPTGVYPNYPGDTTFFGRKKYRTWQEASRAAIALGIGSWADYQAKYKADPRLSGSPQSFYPNFPGVTRFLGKKEKNLYPTWQEASRAAIALGANSKNEYIKAFKADLRLPSNPNATYKDFPGWPKFFGRERKRFYNTWQEASKAARKLGVQSGSQYKKRYSSNSRLPSSPHIVYRDFPGWVKFLGKKEKNLYPTWQEASAAVHRLRITSWPMYVVKHKADPRLPSRPDAQYSDFPGPERFFRG